MHTWRLVDVGVFFTFLFGLFFFFFGDLAKKEFAKLPRCVNHVPAAHWWLSGNVKLGLIWGSVVHCDVFVLVCCAFCMLGNVHLMFLEVLDTHFIKVQGGGYFFWRRLS